MKCLVAGNVRERRPIGAALLERLPGLTLISQNGHVPHIDLEACTRHGVVVCSALTSRPSYAAAEFTWGLIIAAMRHIPFEAEALREGRWQSTIGRGLRGRTLGILDYGWIGKVIANYAKAFEMLVLVWVRENTFRQARRMVMRSRRAARSFLPRAMFFHYTSAQ